MSIGIIFISSTCLLSINESLLIGFDVYRNTGKLHGYIGVHSRDPALSIPERIPIDDLIDRFFLHPQWNESKMNADIALIRLKKDVEYSSKNYFFVLICKICL